MNEYSSYYYIYIMDTTNIRKKRPRHSKKETPSHHDEDDAVERALTASLFGNTPSAALLPPADPAPFTFELDRVGEPSLAIQKNLDEDSEKFHDHPPTSHESKTSAWVDEDDDEIEIGLLDQADRVRKLRTERSETNPLSGSVYQERLRQRFVDTTTSHITWAQTPEPSNVLPSDPSKENDTLEEGPSISTSLLAPTSLRPLRQGRIQMKRCPDVNRSDPSRAVVQVVRFHPAARDPDRPLVLTAGLDKTLRFFQCGEQQSEKVHGVHCKCPLHEFYFWIASLRCSHCFWFVLLTHARTVPNFPIYSASFLGSSGNVVVTGRRPFFYHFDTDSGKVDRHAKIPGREEKSWERSVASPDGRTLALLGNDGYILLYDVQQKSCRTTQHCKLNGSVRTVCFSPEGSELFASGSDGDVYRFDVRNSHRCVERFSNLDGTVTSSLAVARRTWAVGAESGVVNLYGADDEDRAERTPLKSILNLKTSVDALCYNFDGQLLAMSSRREKDALKLVHIASRTVFSNWPTSQTPLGYVWSLDFSPASRFLAIGNDQGKCLLYKILHYEDRNDA